LSHSASPFGFSYFFRQSYTFAGAGLELQSFQSPPTWFLR
jgi:hypothetical protein